VIDEAVLRAAILPLLPEALQAQVADLLQGFIALPLATALGALLAFRPRRRGTPPRSAPVIQTQIVLAVVGAVVMLVVGASLARAFGIVGAANLIRYRAKIEDPKDAVVMLATLSLGLACGVELYALAIFAAFFIMAVLWGIESLEPERRKRFDLTIETPDPTTTRGAVESIFTRYRIDFELRSVGDRELVYQTELPFDLRTDRVSNAILRLHPAGSEGEMQVVWSDRTKK
jgi:hypothetical protein